MQLQELTDFLETLAPPALQEGYDNAGLLVGDPRAEISRAIISLDCTEEVVDEAIEAGAQLVIAHHPIIFKGLKRLTGRNYVERTVLKAIKNDIAVYAIHTNLDHVAHGVNAKICEVIGLKNARILSPKKDLLKKLVTFCPQKQADEVRQALFGAGAGHIGNYDECSYNLEGFGTFRGDEQTNPFAGKKGKQHREPEMRIETIYPAWQENRIIKALLEAHPYEEVAYDLYLLSNVHTQTGAGMVGELETPQPLPVFLKQVKEKLKAGCIRYTRPVSDQVRKIAVCGGAGGFLLREAIRAGADVFITSDYKYHEFFDAEGQIVIADVGHYESEQFTAELLIEKISKHFPNFAPLLSRVNTNPVNYV